MIRVGTSGYSLKEWKGFFYPPGLEQSKYLEHYCKYFDTVEITSTYYYLPSIFIFEEMIKKVPDKFLFCIRVPKEFTHDIANYESKVDDFKKLLQSFIKAKKFGCLLAQFPFSFDPSEKHLTHLKKLAADFEDMLQIEIRNKEWLNENHFAFLKEHKLGFVNLDLPELPNLIPKTARVTNNRGYLRFHGRNKEQWWNKHQYWIRYDYHYKKEELEQWAEDIKELEKLTDTVFVFFNNFHQAYSVANADMLKRILNLSKKPVPMQKEHDTSLLNY